MSLKAFVTSLMALGTSAVTPLAFSKPEDADLNEKKFELKQCVLTTWGSNKAELFKCQIGNKVWVFYLSSNWTQWFYGVVGTARQGNNRGTGKNDLTNVILTLETGHKKIVVTGQNLNKELNVIWLESEKKDKRVFGYAPDVINTQTANQPGQGKSIKQQMVDSLENIQPEIS